MNVLHWSIVKLLAFLGMLLIIWGLTVIVGAAIWGQSYYSFKSWDHAINASCMMFYGKMEFIRDGGGPQIWVFGFTLLWFIMFFLSRGAFFKLQVISVKMINLTSGLIDVNFYKEDKVSNKNLSRRVKQQKKQELIQKIIRCLQWFFGWLPRSMVKNIEEIEKIF